MHISNITSSTRHRAEYVYDVANSNYIEAVTTEQPEDVIEKTKNRRDASAKALCEAERANIRYFQELLAQVKTEDDLIQYCETYRRSMLSTDTKRLDAVRKTRAEPRHTSKDFRYLEEDPYTQDLELFREKIELELATFETDAFISALLNRANPLKQLSPSEYARFVQEKNPYMQIDTEEFFSECHEETANTLYEAMACAKEIARAEVINSHLLDECFDNLYMTQKAGYLKGLMEKQAPETRKLEEAVIQQVKKIQEAGIDRKEAKALLGIMSLTFFPQELLPINTADISEAPTEHVRNETIKFCKDIIYDDLDTFVEKMNLTEKINATPHGENYLSNIRSFAERQKLAEKENSL